MTTTSKTTATTATKTVHVDVLIIGAGPSGLSTCIKLNEQGVHNTVIVDLANRIGGTWALNDYPGLFCDVPSEMYSLGFAPNPNWSRTYAPQAEIQQYLEGVAHQFNIVNQIKLNTKVTDARWDATAKRWMISTADNLYIAKFFVPATGFIGEAKMPEFLGQEKFSGTMFHSGMWNHDYDLTGKRVAVIGSGASAIQFLPMIQPQVKELISFQRTPSWVLPKPDFAMPKVVNKLFKLAPVLQKTIRESALLSLEPSLPIFMHQKILSAATHPLGLLNIRLNVSDRKMREKLTPDHTLGCKRPMFSNSWYAALAKPNVKVLFQGLARITENGVVAEDGQEYPVDAIIFGTGYAVAEPAIYRIIKGADGRTLSDTWQGNPRAYMGMAIHGFPNMFMMLGPNSQNTVGSVMWTAEQQSIYISKSIKTLQDKGVVVVEVKQSVQDKFNTEIDKRLTRMPVRADICKSYYLDASGRNHIIWPEYGFVIKQRLSQFKAADYNLIN
jgi:cation diffusion facilitator CzcD-associated flavoprotein CzcO